MAELPRLAGRIAQRRWIAWGVVALALALSLVPRPGMDNSVRAFVDRGGRAARDYERFVQTLGGDEVVVLMLSSVDEAAVLELAREAHAALERDPSIDQVVSVASAYLEPSGDGGDVEPGRWLERLANRPLNRALSLYVRAGPGSGGSASQPRETVATLIGLGSLQPASSRRPLRAWIEAFRLRARQRGAELHAAGNPLLNLELDDAAARVEQRNLPLLALVSALMTLLLTRRIVATLGLLACVGLGVAASEGLLALAGETTNLIVNIEKPLVFVLLLASGVHVVTRFEDHRALGLGARRAAERAAEQRWLPVSLALATTALGFGSLAVADLHPIRVFGLLTAAGALLGIPLVVFVLPELLSLGGSLRGFGGAGRAPSPSSGDGVAASRLGELAARLVGHGIRHRWLWPGVGVLIVLAGGAALSRLETDPHAIHYLSSEHSLRVDHEAIEARGLGLATLELVVESRATVDADALAALAREARALPGVRRVLGLPLLRAEAVAGAREGVPEPTAVGGTARRRAGGQHQLLLDALSAEGGRVQRLSLLIETLGHGEIVALERKLRAAFSSSGFAEGTTLTVTGNYALLLAGQASLMKTLLLSLMSSVILMQLVLSFATRSWALGALAMLPNLLPVFLGFLVMWALGVPLDVGTSMTAAVALGIAVDDTMHLVHGWLPDDPARTARATGRALVASSAIIAAGFVAIAPTEFLPARHFALLAATAMLAALLADLLVLPALLAMLRFKAER